VTHVDIRVLGSFEVTVDGRVLPHERWQRRRASDLVKLLSLAPRRRLHREQAIEALWPGLAPESGAASLRKAAYYARRSLGDSDAVILREGQVALWPDAVLQVDAERFAAEGEAALRAGDVEACATAAARYRGELLPDDRYADWAEDPRRRLRSLYLELLRAAGLWEQVLAEEPTDEAATRMLMRMFSEAGNRSTAPRALSRAARGACEARSRADSRDGGALP
jgi:DNA-binding SARP family transcriptional activator